MKKIFLLILAMFCLNINAQEEHAHHQKMDTVSKMDYSIHKHSTNLTAPISIMGSHMHDKGSWMFSYRFMNMNMKDLRQGTNDISNLDAHNEGYMVTPLKMPMKMHMLGVMYAPSNKLTLVLMANIAEREMDLQGRMMSGMLVPFSTKSSGFGDLKISGMYKLFNKNKQEIYTQFGFSIPTGSIDIKDVTPMSMGNEVILPYPMQIGSGTVDANLGVTYLGQSDKISWGNQLKGTMRFGKNDNDYRLGNQYKLNNWLAVKANNWLSFSARLEGIVIGEIEGANPILNPMMVTTADTNNSGGTYINYGFGINTYISEGSFNNFRFGFEVGFPIYQKVNGIQLKQNENLMFGVEYSL